jgi:hypothetical protein
VERFAGQRLGHIPLAIEFMDAARTEATVRVTTSSSTGRAIVLRKVDGVWQVIRTGREWIS